MFDYYDLPRATYPFDYERHRALRALRNHEMTIEKDDGVFRSIMFAAPKSSCYAFRLVTWPGHLCISGDMGTHVFSRTFDMFEFFGPPSQEGAAQMPLEINASYWAEKLCANGGRNSVQSPKIDVKFVREMIVHHFRQIPIEDFNEGDRVEAFRSLRMDVLDGLHEDDSLEAVICTIDGWNIPSYFFATSFEDRPLCQETAWEWEIDRREYDFQFLLCCFAIVWGIKRYAQHKTGRDMASHSKQILEGKL